MRFVIFTHSLVSDWNHGNAHFLRGITSELLELGHEVAIYEPEDSWSRINLVREHGFSPVLEFEAAYPRLRSSVYSKPDLPKLLDGADVVILHEWNSPVLISEIGKLRGAGAPFTLFFHDTHHRSLTQSEEMNRLDLGNYDGVLAYGEVIRRRYLERGWARRVWTWHEAADTRLFRPRPDIQRSGDLVWIGNWGDGERSRELREFLIEPVRELGLRARVYGVRYPEDALAELESAGIEYGGWLPNYRVPEVFAQFRTTVHVPRRPYAEVLHGIPTIRPFEALACGIPMVSAPWEDSENLFRPGQDYLVARDGEQMKVHLERLLADPALANSLADSGQSSIQARHTCRHRVQELLTIVRQAARPAMVGQTV